ncbi:hypothetical protein EIB71_02460 [Kaistella daneshvariae]|uniref:Uncharacterized protein n=1 Tax=Kaistella daneshvariae TaxID=2487074 RepID=A0ABM7CB72_9FLAO|nr:hypothetical protein EIB71_02460 [Kaistella daneshvariae]
MCPSGCGLFGQFRAETITAVSGTVCPLGGEWQIIGSVGTTAVFARGSTMTAYHGKNVIWVLLRPG